MSPNTVSRPYWLAAIVIALGAVCLWGASALPAASRYAGIGPGAFPGVVGGALIVLGLLLGFQIYRGESFDPQETENADAHAPVNHKALLLALIAAALPVLTLERLGLPVTATLVFPLVARSFGSRRLLWDVVTGALLGCISWWLFDRLGLQLGDFFPLIDRLAS